MLKSVPYSDDLKDREEIRSLYDRSFPDDERIPWDRLQKTGSSSRLMYVYYDGDEPVGLSYVFLHGSLAYLGYLAVEENRRRHGYGSMILSMIQKTYAQRRIVIDIEIVDRKAENYEERLARRNFYLHNGFQRSGIGYYFYNVDYELLVCSGPLKAQEYRALILEHWGKIAERAVFKTIPSE